MCCVRQDGQKGSPSVECLLLGLGGWSSILLPGHTEASKKLVPTASPLNTQQCGKELGKSTSNAIRKLPTCYGSTTLVAVGLPVGREAGNHHLRPQGFTWRQDEVFLTQFCV